MRCWWQGRYSDGQQVKLLSTCRSFLPWKSDRPFCQKTLILFWVGTAISADLLDQLSSCLILLFHQLDRRQGKAKDVGRSIVEAPES
jgi:hypothetical protein